VIDDDPGWGISWRTLLYALVPQLGMARDRRMAETGTIDGLLALRRVFVSFVIAIVLMGVVVVFLDSGGEPPDDPQTAVAVVLLALGAGSATIGPRLARPLDCTSDATLANGYRTRFFLRIAFSEAAALLGFVAFFLTSAWWPYPLGAAIALAGFARAAPTAAHLAADQDELATRGCGRSLVNALRHPSAD
jgi:hypothetical protein